MKKNKLTPAEVQNLSMALALQFQGEQIAIGRKWNYNENMVYSGRMKHIVERNSMAFLQKSNVGNRVFGKSLKNSECLDYLNFGYCEFYNIVSINVSKVLSFDNGKIVIDTALTLMGTH
jgi:hypothetical protein